MSRRTFTSGFAYAIDAVLCCAERELDAANFDALLEWLLRKVSELAGRRLDEEWRRAA